LQESPVCLAKLGTAQAFRNVKKNITNPASRMIHFIFCPHALQESDLPAPMWWSFA
jgi:hypothetical protein